jgi:hypothetical protein
MKPNKKEEANKELLAAVKESNELYKVRRDTPWVKLDKPIHTGWTKCHVLRDDCKARSDADVFKRILGVIDVPIFSRRKDFKVRNGIVMNAGLRVIRENAWDKLEWPESFKKYFLYGAYFVEWDMESRYRPTHYPNKKLVVGFKLKQEFYFEEVIKPYLVTHRQPILPDIESRLAELDSFIENNGGWTKWEYLKKGSSYRHRDWADYNSVWLNKEDQMFCLDQDSDLLSD